MPVQSAEALEKAQWRYLLKDATWTVLEFGDIGFSSAH